jgi:muramidase (phage lysozyme)
MSLSGVRYRSILNSRQVQAWLHVIRHGESSHDDSAWTVINGGAHFTDYAAHPFAGLRTTEGGRAAGAFQFIPTTWGEAAADCGLTDFGPEAQQIAALWATDRRGALDDVLAGHIDEAVAKCRQEWTSLPGAAEASGRYTLAGARQVFTGYGGTLADASASPAPATPVPEPIPTQPAAPIIERGTPMPIPALLSVFAPIIAEIIPQVAKIFDPKSEVAKRNVALGQLIADKFVEASGEKNLQSAAEAVQASPELAKQVQQAVVTDPEVMQLLEVGGGIAKAREADVVATQGEKPFWYSPAFWITASLMPLLYWTVGAVLMNWGGGFVQEIRASTVGTVVGMILGGVMGYWLGTSFSGRTKDISISDLARKV